MKSLFFFVLLLMSCAIASLYFLIVKDPTGVRTREFFQNLDNTIRQKVNGLLSR